ncbi:MAG: hypothetical protein WA326_10490 [Nitrososphaeraceae archaeon]
MPEIWLRYGTTDIPLDIRFENLNKNIGPASAHLPDEQARNKLQEIPLKENCLLVVLSSSALTRRVLSWIIDSATNKRITGFNIVILPKLKDFIDIRNEKYASAILNANDLLSLNETMNKFQGTFFLSHSTYDPIFGFEGTPTHLLRNFSKEMMSEAIRLRSGDLPTPGIISEPYSLALSVCKNIDATSIEIVGNSNNLIDMYCSSIEESFKNAASTLKENSIIEPHRVKSEIISPGCDPIHHFTLTESLNCLWNCVNILSENGSAILLSEARGGLGCEALEMCVQGRPPVPLSAESEKFIEGQEHLIFLEAMREKYDIGVISTIPQHYLKTKLGLETFDGLKQVMAKLLSKYGKNHKVTLISEGRSTLTRLDPGLKREFNYPS